MTLESFLQILGPSLLVFAGVYLGLRKSAKTDKAAIASGAVANHRAGIDQSFKIMSELVETLQAAGKEDRASLKELDLRFDAQGVSLKETAEKLLEALKDRDQCHREVARLQAAMKERDDQVARLRKLYGTPSAG